MSQSVVFEDLLHEKRRVRPRPEFVERAVVSDESLNRDATDDSHAFWERMAGELEWMRRWDTVCEWDPPRAKWFVGGKLNLSANCLDRHVRTSRRNKAAIIWEGENFEQ